MVHVIIKIVQNSSLLRIDAPEWYPDFRKHGIEKEEHFIGKKNGHRVT